MGLGLSWCSPTVETAAHPDDTLLCREEATKDLIRLAAEGKLLDEPTARKALGDKPATAETLVDFGFLKAQDLDQLLSRYHEELSQTLRVEQAASATCGRCGRRMTHAEGELTCEPCGIRVKLHAEKVQEPPMQALPPEVAEAAKDPTNRVGRYITYRKLGEGAFGAVLLAWDSQLSRQVALKFLKGPGPTDLVQFHREASLAARLSHPNIAAVHEVGGDPPYIAMQYVDGATASDLKPSVAEAVRIVKTTAEAVQAAHEKGIIHRDIKPSNIMLDEDGRVFVMDFGLAKRTDVDSEVSQSGHVVGTPAYMSPEQATGQSDLDGRTDVYSLGATLYALLAGGPPFQGPVVEVLRKVVIDEPPPLKVDRDLRTIIAKAMEKDAGRRYRSAKKLAGDLGRYLAGDPIQARPADWLYRLQKSVKRNRLLYTIGALGVVGIALALAILLPGWREAEQAKASLKEKTRSLRSAEESKTEAWRLVDAIRQSFEDAIRQSIEGAKISSLYRKGASLEVLEEQRSRALDQLDRMEPKFPPFPELSTLRGDILSLDLMVLQSEERFHSAMAAYGQALRIDPSYAPANLGRGLLGLRRYMYDLSVFHAMFGMLREEMARHEPSRRLAIEDLRVAVERRAGEEWMIRLAEAGSALAAGDLEGAERLTTEALKASPREEFYFVRANVRLAAYDFKLALEDTAAAIEIRPNYPEALYLQAQLSWMSGQFSITERSLREASRLAPVHPLGVTLQVLWEFRHDRTDQIPPLLDRLAELAPERGLGPALAGLVWLALGKTDRAKELCEQALEVNPDLDAVYGIRSLAKLIEGDEAGAAKDLKRAVKRNPAGAHPYLMIALFEMDSGDPSKAEAYCTLAIEAAEKNALAWAVRGLVRATSGKEFAGFIDMAKALKLDPNLDKQLAHLRRPVKLLFVRSDRAHRRALSMQQRGKDPTKWFQGAVEHLDEALKLHPNTGLKAELHRSRASVRISWASYKRSCNEDATGDYERALQDLTTSVEIEPSSIQSLTDRGWARVQWAIYKIDLKEEAMAHLKSAREDFNVAVGLAPDDADILWRRGRCHDLMRNWAAAVEDFESASKLDPSSVRYFQHSWDHAKKYLGEK